MTSIGRILRNGLLTKAGPRRRLAIVFVLVVLGAASSGAAAPPTWTTVTEGIDYRSYVLSGPIVAYVARMDLTQPDVVFDSTIAHGVLGTGLQTVSAMAKDYDGALNAWDGGWGARNQVWVAINGSFYDMEQGRAYNGILQGGWYSQRFDDLQGQSGLAFKLDRSVFVGGCPFHNPEKQRALNLSADTWISIDAINSRGKRNDVVLYNHHYGGFSPGGGNRSEVVIELIRPAGLLPVPAYVPGVVLEVRDGLGPVPIMFNQVVLSVRGERRSELLAAFSQGARAGISMEITDMGPDCRGGDQPSWTKAYASVGGNIVFLRDGAIPKAVNDVSAIRHPRTALCYNDNYLFFVVVDGRDDSYSIGMTIPELAEFCRGKLRADWGVNLDGGGSSTMWVNGIVQNKPSDGRERGVANGLMMVRVEPAERSTLFAPGEKVAASSPANVFTGPGTNFTAIASVGTGAKGIILPERDDLNGILAKDRSWWKVDFGGVIGWVDELVLARAPDSPADLLLPGFIERLQPAGQ